MVWSADKRAWYFRSKCDVTDVWAIWRCNYMILMFQLPTPTDVCKEAYLFIHSRRSSLSVGSRALPVCLADWLVVGMSVWLWHSQIKLSPIKFHTWRFIKPFHLFRYFWYCSIRIRINYFLFYGTLLKLGQRPIIC